MLSKNQKINDIFRQFLYADKLKFSEIERKTGIRSNELAYLVKRMVREGILEKSNEHYVVSEEYEKHIPLFPEASETTPLPVVLVACLSDGKILLVKRKKRAYKDYWSLPGGRIRTGETLKEASLRILKEKTFIDADFVSVNAVLHEHYGKGKNVKNAFILFLTRAKALNEIKEKEHLKYFGRDETKNINMVPSDLWLIENRLDKNIDVREEMLEETKGRLSMKLLN